MYIHVVVLETVFLTCVLCPKVLYPVLEGIFSQHQFSEMYQHFIQIHVRLIFCQIKSKRQLELFDMASVSTFSLTLQHKES